MISQFNLSQFIRDVTGRQQSLFAEDIESHREHLRTGIDGTRVLAIGAAGTIGSAFVKSLLPFRPVKVVVVDSNENGLAELVRDCRSTHGLPIPDDFITYPVSFADPVFDKILAGHGPFDIVANFAAHKHVRSEKDRYSIEAMLENNVFRARDLLERLVDQRPKHFFCVSTDKAANPVNVMGASKKIMEDLIIAYSDRLPVRTARFANVAFSNGSLLQGFLERLMKGQPLSAPRDVQRYFVSPEESGEICMLACMLGRSGDLFYPKLDAGKDMRRFSDIGEALLERLGLEPVRFESEESARAFAVERMSRSGGDCKRKYPIYFFDSNTTGEKPYEEFVGAGEVPDLERFRALGVIRPVGGKSIAQLEAMIGSVRRYMDDPEATKAGVVARMGHYLGDFAHVETGRNLDQRM
ncbi:MAG: polysaccharide biosynthesis protein [Lautropia sp.]